ncbi:MAG: acyl-CoA dehydrogenase family protein, partial [Bacteroidota bacterium]
QDFIDKEIYPILDRLDAQEDNLTHDMLKKAGELGLLGVSIPAKYDGFEQNFITSMMVADYIGSGHGFSVAFSAHTGIGSLPLLYYGNEEQKQKYLPKLATGEHAAAYCLTEPNAGSDANAGKSKAILSEDGQNYIINGQKMWITNGGFADLFTVFAKIDDDRVLSAFLIESKWEGVILNPEEKKMGIKSSSTRQIFFNDVKVPVGNLLGKRGEGFRIALNILHVGRVKLGASVLGGGRMAIKHSVVYANERKQFGKFISEFGAIKYKIAEQAIKQFTTESSVYRCSGDINNTIVINISKGMSSEEAEIDAIAKFSIEAAILKVYGSEGMDYIVDEAVQIYGGMGFSSDSPVDRCFRDSRINRIFEGTNEINRLVVIDTLLKFIKRGDYPLFEIGNSFISENEKMDTCIKTSNYYKDKFLCLKNLKKAIIITLTAAHNELKNQFGQEQQIMMNISDMIIQLYSAESTYLRVKKAENLRGIDYVEYFKYMLDVHLYDASDIIRKNGIDAINSFASGDLQVKLYNAVNRLCETTPVNIKDYRRKIADKIIENNKYCF